MGLRTVPVTIDDDVYTLFIAKYGPRQLSAKIRDAMTAWVETDLEEGLQLEEIKQRIKEQDNQLAKVKAIKASLEKRKEKITTEKEEKDKKEKNIIRW